MTHFIIGVIVPKEVFENGEAEGYIENLMIPYSESLKVKPYIDRTKEEVKKRIEEFKRELLECIESGELKDYQKKYSVNGKLIKKPFKWWVEEYFNQELDGEGNLLSTYNKDCFFDWYVIGGRWCGVLTGKKVISDDGFNFDEKCRQLEENSIKIKELLIKFNKKNKSSVIFRKEVKKIINYQKEGIFNKPFGFFDIFREYFKTEELNKEQEELYNKIMDRVLKQLNEYEVYNNYLLPKVLSEDGLIEQKSFGWFGTSENKQEIEDYIKEYIKLLEKHKEDYIVNLDCHI